MTDLIKLALKCGAFQNEGSHGIPAGTLITFEPDELAAFAASLGAKGTAGSAAEALLTEIRTALNASGVWHLGMDTVDVIKSLIASRQQRAVLRPEGEDMQGSAWGRLYTAANALVVRIGYKGEIDSRADEVESLKYALAGLDGGEWMPGLTPSPASHPEAQEESGDALKALQRLERAVDLHLGRSAWTQTTHLKGMVYSEQVRKELFAAHDEARAAIKAEGQPK